jgi:serine/threonine-protein kinase
MLGARYRIIRQLGQGGFGRTYLAEDFHRFNEPCVLKEFAPQVHGTYALQKAAELFEREAGVLYKLQHPQIPRFRELFRVKQEDQGLLFLVQDFVAGQTYRALLDARKRQGHQFNEAEVTQLLLQILPVLDYIHSIGVIHRDISPDNLILRSTDGLPVLIDFGGVKQVAATAASQFIASQGSDGIPLIATRLGKVGYAPHEQMQAGIVYPHSDLYALAATVLVLVTGKEPQQLIDPHTLEWNWRQEVNLSPSLGSVLDKMLQAIPGDRFPNASAVLQALGATPPAVTYPPTQLPLPNTEATLPVTPPVNPPPPPPAQTPSPSSTRHPSSALLGKIVLLLVATVVAGGFGWLAGNLWLYSQIKKSQVIKSQPTTNPTPVSPISPTANPEAPPSPQFSDDELRRKEALQQRRVALDIRYNFYADLVNEKFWAQYPEQQGRQLGTGPEDAEFRARWDAIASDVLRQVEQANLTDASRPKLGSYGEADLIRAKAEANQLHVSSRTLYDLVDAKFFEQFPQQKGKQFLKKPIGQLWYAMIIDTLNTLKSRDALERITFDPGSVSKQVSGTLQPGEGKVFIANFSAGQAMKVRLSTAENVLFSIYSPSGKTALLEDSRDRRWSGQLPESGYYEFVVVSDASRPINYQLDLTVENSPTPTPSPVKSTGQKLGKNDKTLTR